MADTLLTITLIGGPTALLEFGGLRLLTDPTFSPPGAYQSGSVTLTKVRGPAIAAEALPPIDVVLLSHDQHADNLDDAGRALLAHAKRVITTSSGAGRLGGHVEGLVPWQTTNIAVPGNRQMQVTATPARHGPAGIEPITGEVVGFVLALEDQPDHAIYITGDTVWYSGVAEVARRFNVTAVLAYAGAARTRGPIHLTMDTNEVIETASAFPHATIVPLHHEGWAHFTESQTDIAKAFAVVGLSSRLQLLEPGVAVNLKV
jgi:L-ascorbate metabolism protein UlaG (beta-lactamase superfamily)